LKTFGLEGIVSNVVNFSNCAICQHSQKVSCLRPFV